MEVVTQEEQVVTTEQAHVQEHILQTETETEIETETLVQQDTMTTIGTHVQTTTREDHVTGVTTQEEQVVTIEQVQDTILTDMCQTEHTLIIRRDTIAHATTKETIEIMYIKTDG